ncbi:MAG: extracellular solute-binding protein [Planctomycetota bacterium]
MGMTLGRVVMGALLVLIVGVPVLLRLASGGESTARASSGGERLIIRTPHNEQIRHEFTAGFNRWRAEQGLAPITIDWRTGGTSDLRKQTLAEYGALAARDALDEGVGIDLFFGGGDYDHGKLASGVMVGESRQPVSEVPRIDPALLAEAFPSETIGGEPLVHPEGLWIGTALSSFGIVYNRDVVEMLGATEPADWTDLADPRLAGWVALADPSHSGSIAQTYNVILRRLGWERGWEVLRESFANARYFAASSSKVPVDASAGEAAAGMCIDFYGRYQAGAIGGDRVGYADPSAPVASGERVSTTVTTADPMSLLRGAPHRELAEQFIAWVISPEAQNLWQRKLGEEGGPTRFELRRQPVRADLFTPENRATWTDPEIDPFGVAAAVPDGTPNYFGVVATLTQAMGIDVHDDLKAAWLRLRDGDWSEAEYAEAYGLLHAMPAELSIDWPTGLDQKWTLVLADPSHPRRGEVVETLDAFMGSIFDRWGTSQGRINDRLAWTLFFRENYRAVASGDIDRVMRRSEAIRASGATLGGAPVAGPGEAATASAG